jgi:hypothetical protein
MVIGDVDQFVAFAVVVDILMGDTAAIETQRQFRFR